MKFKAFGSLVMNKNNKQYVISLRKKKLAKLGLTPEELMELIIPKPKVKFYKKKNDK